MQENSVVWFLCIKVLVSLISMNYFCVGSVFQSTSEEACVNKMSDAVKAKLKVKLEKLLAKHGSAYAVSKAIGKTAQTIYEQMKRVGIKPQGKGNPVVKEKNLKELKALLKKCGGNVKKVAEALDVSIQTVYGRMRQAGLKTAKKKGLPGEPEDTVKRRAWLLKKMKGRTVKEVAEELECSTATISMRLRKSEIRLRDSKLFPVMVLGCKAKDAQKKKHLKNLLKQHGSVKAVAKEVGLTVQSIYEAMRRYLK